MPDEGRDGCPDLGCLIWGGEVQRVDRPQDEVMAETASARLEQRMERQRRLAPEDLAIAHANLRKLIGLMKKEAVFLGKPDRLDNATFHAAHRRLRRQASLTAFALWPFWPHNFVATD